MITISNYFDDKETQNELLYGVDGQYNNIDIDFWEDVYPTLLEAYFFNKRPYQISKLTKESLIKLINSFLTGIFAPCFNIDIQTNSGLNLSDKELEDLKLKDGLVGELARLETNRVGSLSRIKLYSIIAFVKEFKKEIIHLTNRLPIPLYDSFKTEIKEMFYALAQRTNNDNLIKEIDKVRFLIHPQAIQKIKKLPEYRIEKTDNGKVCLIFEHINFSRKNQNFFWDLLTFKGGKDLIDTIFFLNCKFSHPYETNELSIHNQVVFKKCVFQKDFSCPKEIWCPFKFEDCHINGKFRFQNVIFLHRFIIKDCHFTDTSSLLLDNISPLNKGLDRDNKLSITDTVFLGEFSMTNANLAKSIFILKNVSFFEPFYFNGTVFGNENTFENIAFSAKQIQRMDMCKHIFADILMNFGYEGEAHILGLEKTKKNKPDNPKIVIPNVSDKDGWLSPQEAAIYLGKSKSWLAKKRIEDKKKRTKKSIPFIGSRKGIQYSKQALDAYRIGNWSLLKTLVERFGFGSEEGDLG